MQAEFNSQEVEIASAVFPEERAYVSGEKHFDVGPGLLELLLGNLRASKEHAEILVYSSRYNGSGATTGRDDGLFKRDLGGPHFLRNARQFRGALGRQNLEVLSDCGARVGILARDRGRQGECRPVAGALSGIFLNHSGLIDIFTCLSDIGL